MRIRTTEIGTSNRGLLRKSFDEIVVAGKMSVRTLTLAERKKVVENRVKKI